MCLASYLTSMPGFALWVMELLVVNVSTFPRLPVVSVSASDYHRDACNRTQIGGRCGEMGTWRKGPWIHRSSPPTSRSPSGFNNADPHTPSTYSYSLVFRVRGQLLPCPQMGNHPPSPTSRLPPELLTGTFKYLTTRSSQMVLPQICHHWADVAPSVSSLWFRVDFSTPPAPFMRRCIDGPVEVSLWSSLFAPVKPNWLSVARETLHHHT